MFTEIVRATYEKGENRPDLEVRTPSNTNQTTSFCTGDMT